MAPVSKDECGKTQVANQISCPLNETWTLLSTSLTLSDVPQLNPGKATELSQLPASVTLTKRAGGDYPMKEPGCSMDVESSESLRHGQLLNSSLGLGCSSSSKEYAYSSLPLLPHQPPGHDDPLDVLLLQQQQQHYCGTYTGAGHPTQHEEKPVSPSGSKYWPRCGSSPGGSLHHSFKDDTKTDSEAGELQTTQLSSGGGGGNGGSCSTPYDSPSNVSQSGLHGLRSLSASGKAKVAAGVQRDKDIWQKRESGVKKAQAANGKSDRELVLLDPKRVRRIMANRESAAKSKDRKLKYANELRGKLEVIEAQGEAINERVTDLQHDSTLLERYNTDMVGQLQRLQHMLSKITDHNKDLVDELFGLQLSLNMEQHLPEVRSALSGAELVPALPQLRVTAGAGGPAVGPLTAVQAATWESHIWTPPLSPLPTGARLVSQSSPCIGGGANGSSDAVMKESPFTVHDPLLGSGDSGRATSKADCMPMLIRSSRSETGTTGSTAHPSCLGLRSGLDPLGHALTASPLSTARSAELSNSCYNGSLEPMAGSTAASPSVIGRGRRDGVLGSGEAVAALGLQQVRPRGSSTGTGTGTASASASVPPLLSGQANNFGANPIAHLPLVGACVLQFDGLHGNGDSTDGLLSSGNNSRLQRGTKAKGTDLTYRPTGGSFSVPGSLIVPAAESGCQRSADSLADGLQGGSMWQLEASMLLPQHFSNGGASDGGYSSPQRDSNCNGHHLLPESLSLQQQQQQATVQLSGRQDSFTTGQQLQQAPAASPSHYMDDPGSFGSYQPTGNFPT